MARLLAPNFMARFLHSFTPSTAQSSVVAVNPTVSIPWYVQEVYPWAYLLPQGIRFWDQTHLADAILYGQYGKLRDACIDSMRPTDAPSAPVRGRSLQISCAYGDITLRLAEALDPSARLDLIDVVPNQLHKLAEKLPAAALKQMTLEQQDATALSFPDGTYDQTLLYFLLHELPADCKRKVVAEAFRVLKPGGRLVVCDFHDPARWNPCRQTAKLVFYLAEPFAREMWAEAVETFLPAGATPKSVTKVTYLGGMFQRVVIEK